MKKAIKPFQSTLWLTTSLLDSAPSRSSPLKSLKQKWTKMEMTSFKFTSQTTSEKKNSKSQEEMHSLKSAKVSA